MDFSNLLFEYDEMLDQTLKIVKSGIEDYHEYIHVDVSNRFIIFKADETPKISIMFQCNNATDAKEIIHKDAKQYNRPSYVSYMIVDLTSIIPSFLKIGTLRKHNDKSTYEMFYASELLKNIS